MRRERAKLGAVAGALASVLAGASASADPRWQYVEPMPTPRAYHASAAAANRWYVAGGDGTFQPGVAGDAKFPPDIDVYDPSSGHWIVAGQLASGRDTFAAILDPSSARVLFAGGSDDGTPLATCALGSSNGVSPGPSLLTPRYLHAGAFAGGKFVVSGGWGLIRNMFLAMLDDAEVLDADLLGWSSAGKMPAGPRVGHSMTTLQDGKDVLVVGGCQPDHAMTEVDRLDVASGEWLALSPLSEGRCRHKSVLLADGRVLVTGGIITSPPSIVASAEIFDPGTNRWTAAASMRDQRSDHDMVMLPDGRVVVVGGSNDSAHGEYGALSSVEIYDPVADTWTPAPSMQDRRRWPTLAVLSDGIYVAGGDYADGLPPSPVTVLASVERLSWADLGVIGPGQPDAGTPDGSGQDGSDDAAAPNDGATDAAQPGDAGMDQSIRDSASSDRAPDGRKTGCSCSLTGTRATSFGNLALVGMAACIARRRRSRPRSVMTSRRR